MLKNTVAIDGAPKDCINRRNRIRTSKIKTVRKGALQWIEVNS
jgi:hypothetical protein